MKHLCAIILSLLCALSLCGCRENKPVVNTANVSRILCCGLPDAADGIELPSEDMPEMIAWLESFTVGSPVSSKGLPPGSNSYWIIIEYRDGQSTAVGIDAVEYDGKLYFVEREPVPDCFFEVFDAGN